MGDAVDEFPSTRDQREGAMPHQSIVLYEHDPPTRAQVTKTLEGAGFRVATAGTGAQVRKLVVHTDPVAVILDVDPGPGPAGLDIAAALTREAPKLPLLFLTSHADPQLIGRMTETIAGPAATLRKENLAEPGVLVANLANLLSGSTDGQP